jgi:hypothetical protein
MVGTSSEETSGKTEMMTIQDHLMSACKTDKSEMVTTSPARRKTENETKEECLAVTVAPMIEGKPLGLLQVNC